MPHDLLNHPLVLQILQGLSRKTPIDLQSVDKDRNGDESVGLDVFIEFVRCAFVEDDRVVGFVFYLEETDGVG